MKTDKHLLIDGLSIEEFVKKETEPKVANFWGEESTITPALVSKIHGDGLQVVYLCPIDTRPNYYVLRIDSSIDVRNDNSLSKEDKENYGAVFELLLSLIEEDYDNINRYDEMDDGKYIERDYEQAEPFEYKFPMLSWGGGSWGMIANFKTGKKGR